MFKLHFFGITKHKYFKELDLFFVNDNELIEDGHLRTREYKEPEGPYTSLIIGPNGTGKSQILNVIVEVFNYLAAAKTNPNLKMPFDFRFIFKYFLNDVEYHLNCLEGPLKLWIHGTESPITEIRLPQKFIASAINLNDRFPNVRETSKYYTEHYEYLGIRSTPNSAYISYHIKKIIDSLSDAAGKLSTITNIKILFEKLYLQPSFTISFKPGRRFVLKSDSDNNIHSILKDRKSFLKYFSDFISRTRSRRVDERRLSKYEKILSDTEGIDKAITFLKQRADLFQEKYLYKIKLKYKIDFNKPQTLRDFVADAEILKTLRDLEIFSVDNINLQKVGTPFRFEQASSGEYHLLTSLLGIIGKIEENSIVLIDEPEISLHPNWQMQYMDILNKVFESYKSCHFIIASHSHFLVSDLKGYQSAILALKIDKQTGKIISDLKDVNTYSWSAEKVLLEIFEVPTTRNFYIADLVGEILQLMSNPDTPNSTIREKIQKLKELNLENLSESDPLKEVVDKLIAKLNANETRPEDRKN